MSELQAAVGCAQLDRLDDLLSARAEAASHYDEVLDAAAPALHRPGAAPVGTRSWFVYVVRLPDDSDARARDRLIDRLQANGIGCAPYFPTIHLQPLYRDRFGFSPGDFPVTEHVAARTLALPFFSGITEAQIERVADVVGQEVAAVVDA